MSTEAELDLVKGYTGAKYMVVLGPVEEPPDGIFAALTPREAGTLPQLFVTTEPQDGGQDFAVRIRSVEYADTGAQNRPEPQQSADDIVIQVGPKPIIRFAIFAAIVYTVSQVGLNTATESFIKEMAAELQVSKLSIQDELEEQHDYHRSTHSMVEAFLTDPRARERGLFENKKFLLAVARVLCSLQLILEETGATFATFESIRIPPATTNCVGLKFKDPAFEGDIPFASFFTHKKPHRSN